jgi:hypothetical protein
MNIIKKSKLAVFFHYLISIFYCLYIGWLALIILGSLLIIIDPDSSVSRYFVSTTMFELSPLDSTQVYKANSSDPSAQLEMELLGHFKNRTGNRVYNFLVLLGLLLWQGLYLVVINQLKKFLFTITEGTSFVNENVRRIRMLGFCLIAAELVRIVFGYIFITYMKGTVSVPGARISYLDFAFYWEFLNLEIIFAGFIILVIAEVFKIGINLREEQELTI